MLLSSEGGICPNAALMEHFGGVPSTLDLQLIGTGTGPLT